MTYRVPASHNYGLTYYRNFYNNRVAGGRSGAKAIKVLQQHMTDAPVWDAANQDTVDGPGGIQIPYDIDGTVPCNGAVDVVKWLKAEINSDTIDCKVSFICSLVQETGIMPQEDLDIFIAHKQNYVRATERGRAIVSQYHKLGAVLERKMQQDLYRYKVYEHLYEEWLKEVVQYIKDEEFDLAEETYFEAIKYLAKRYNMEGSLIDFTEQTIVCTDEDGCSEC